MRILQILPELNVGGVETGTVDFAKYLTTHGHYSVVVSNGGELVKSLIDSGSKHYALPVHKKSLWTMMKMIPRLRSIIEQERIDVVHARSRVPAWIAYFACRRTNASFITTCHGYYSNRFFSQVMGFSKYVIVPSEAIGRHMVQDFKVPPENIRRIPRSVDLDKFKNIKRDADKNSPPVIAIIGRITPLKGHTYFLEAMAKVIRHQPFVKIWVIGEAPAHKAAYRQELVLLTERLGLKEHVEFLGNRQDIPQLLSKVAVLVLSTVTQESFGRVILEAQAASVAVVATKVGGVADIIDDEKTGLLVSPKDTDHMAKQVLRLLTDQVLKYRLIDAAHEKLNQQFTLEHMASRTLQVYEELLSLMNILVIKISSVGDVVLVTASLRALRKKFPKAKIYCLVGKESRKILQTCPYLDGILVYDAEISHILGLFKFSRVLRRNNFDIIIDFQNNKKSHLLTFLSLPKKSFGFDNGKGSFLLTDPVKNYQSRIAPVDHQWQILKAVGISDADKTSLELWPSTKDRQYAKNLLESEWLGNCKNIVGLNIAASPKWKTKNWPVEHMAKLCDMLSNKNIRVVLTGQEKDRNLAKHLLSKTKAKPANLVGKTDILQLASVIKECQVYITPDSAPLHIAAAMHTPVICFFGPTDSRRHLPPAKQIAVLEKKLTCAPCYSTYCRILTHVCMKDITPEEVAQKVEMMIGGNS